jgi:hypothetical protein
LALLAGLRLRSRPSARRIWMTAWEAVGLGHLYAAVPDILFLSGELLHVRWMDAFALHITVHFIPAPVVTVLVLFLIAALGYGLAISRRRRAAAGSIVVAGAAFAVAVGLAAPLPSSIDELRNDPRLALHSGQHHSSEAQAR